MKIKPDTTDRQTRYNGKPPKINNEKSNQPTTISSIRPKRNIYNLKNKARKSLLLKSKILKLNKKSEIRQRRLWSIKQMKMAIELVKAKSFSLTHAANKYSIPLSTLSSYIKEDRQLPEETEESINEIGADEDMQIELENDHTKPKEPAPRVMYMARKSTSPLKIYIDNHVKNKNKQNLKQNNFIGKDILKDYEQQQANKLTRTLRPSSKESSSDSNKTVSTNLTTRLFIDSLINSNPKSNVKSYESLNNFESKNFYSFFIKCFSENNLNKI